MCGINVILDPDANQAALLPMIQHMNAGMQYRGPDGEGTFAEGPIAMGMRRLAIIDVAGGGQPLFSEEGDIILVCNGEIYNHVELRRDLVAKGHTFRTNSDCEVIIHGYQEAAHTFVDRLRGMFAFALWDRRQQRLVVGRDRYGIKPLYTARHGRRIAFSSELKALLRAGLAPATIDSAVFMDSLRYTYPVDPVRTLARHVDRVAPATMIAIDADGTHARSYWHLPVSVQSGGPVADSVGIVEDAFAETVAMHMRSDVPVAVLLSGGIDSAAIMTFAAKSSGQVRCITAGYQGSYACDERADAHRIAAFHGMPCDDVALDSSDFPRLLATVAQHCDEPALDIASIAQWALYQHCRERGYKVVLSGLGGDELFFGYPFWNQVGARLATFNGLTLPRWSEPTLRSLAHWQPRFRHLIGPHWPGPYNCLLESPLAASHESLLTHLEAVWPSSGATPIWARASSADGPDAVYATLLRAYLAHNGLQLADKLGMGNSIELRVPMVDHRLAECVSAIPLNQRFSSVESKPLLRRLMQGRMPEDLRIGAKRGFAPPIDFVWKAVEMHRERVLDAPVVRQHFAVDRVASLMGAALEPLKRPRWRDRPRTLRFQPEKHAAWFLFALTSSVLTLDAWSSQ